MSPNEVKESLRFLAAAREAHPARLVACVDLGDVVELAADLGYSVSEASLREAHRQEWLMAVALTQREAQRGTVTSR